MLSATAALSGLSLIAAGLAGLGSLGLVLAVALAFLNLATLAVLVGLTTRAIGRGEPAAAGLAALYGKTLVLLGALALLGGAVGFEPVAIGFVLVMSCFTIAAPMVALFHRSTPQTVEAL
ncbi:MAG: hypothetical protein H6737_29075 [Alphaproteobacteria bacterium]|nr:hypothetical protein [Alphaproteobacteria bacterium]